MAAVPPFAQPEVKLEMRLAMSLLRPVPAVGTFGAIGALSASDFIAGIVEAIELMLKLEVVRLVVVMEAMADGAMGTAESCGVAMEASGFCNCGVSSGGGCTAGSLFTSAPESEVKSGVSTMCCTSTVPPSTRIRTACSNADTVKNCAFEKYLISALPNGSRLAGRCGEWTVVAFIVTKLFNRQKGDVPLLSTYRTQPRKTNTLSIIFPPARSSREQAGSQNIHPNRPYE